MISYLHDPVALAQQAEMLYVVGQTGEGGHIERAFATGERKAREDGSPTGVHREGSNTVRTRELGVRASTYTLCPIPYRLPLLLDCSRAYLFLQFNNPPQY